MWVPFVDNTSIMWILYPSHVSINIPAPWIRHGSRLVPKALRSLVVRTSGGSNWKFESQNGPLEVFHQVGKMYFTWKWWGKHHWYYTRRTVLDVRHMYINKAKFDVSTIHHRIHLVIWTETNMDPTSNNIWLDLAIRNSDLACAS